MPDHLDALRLALADRYRIEEHLGAGGMAFVYRAHDLRHERTVAVKVLRPELSHAIGHDRFLREIHLTARLDHPHILPVLDSGSAGGVLYYVMPYVEGETLRGLLEREKQLPLDDALQIAREVADALEYAHRHGVVHRDVKPENILLASGHARVADFGIARAVTAAGDDQLTATGLVLGTPTYMSPEQAGGGEDVDGRSDVYALGCVTYEMLAGHPPFTGGSAREVITRHSIDSIPRLRAARPSVPEHVEDAIRTALAKAPADRFRTAALFAEALAGPRAGNGAARTPRRLAPALGARRLALGGLAVTVLAAAGSLLLPAARERLGLDSGYARTAIAVLPFENLSAEAGDAYFAAGLHEELLTQLSKVSGLSLRGRASVLGYAGTNKPVARIGEELQVGTLVVGSVMVAGGRLRVSVRLIDAGSDEHLWGESYDRTLDDAFAIQTELARQVVAAVGAAMTAAEAERIADVPTTNPEAYRLYLQGRDYAGRPERTRQTFEAARVQFERAVALDPGFALAHAALSEMYGRLYWFRFDPSPRAAARQLDEAEAALRLDPDLPQAHVAMGLAHYYGQLDFRQALAEFTIARDALPGDAWTWWWWSMIQRRLGNWPDHLAGLEQVKRLDPRQARAWLEGGHTKTLLRRYPAAVKDLGRALELSPDLHEARFGRALTFLLWLGRLDSLRVVLDALPEHAELGSWGTVEAQRLLLWILERRADSVLHHVARAPAAIFESQRFLVPAALHAAWAHRWRGERSATDSALRVALTSLDSIRQALPDDPRVHAARGLALAWLGRGAEARDEARWLEESVTYREDAVLGPSLAEFRARILAKLGDVDGAIGELERLLDSPAPFSAWLLRLDPGWDPIRRDPRFQALLSRQGTS